LHEVFFELARTTPAAPALSWDGVELSYAEVGARVRRLAALLRAHAVGPDVLVAISAERSVGMVVAVLAVLEAGGAFLLIDPGPPAERPRCMLEDAAPTLVISGGAAAELAGIDALIIDPDGRVAAEAPSGEPTPVAPSALAYVIYTSGSTGTPKGVLVE